MCMWHKKSNMAVTNIIYHANKAMTSQSYLESFYNKAWYDRVMMVSLIQLLRVEARKHHKHKKTFATLSYVSSNNLNKQPTLCVIHNVGCLLRLLEET